MTDQGDNTPAPPTALQQSMRKALEAKRAAAAGRTGASGGLKSAERAAAARSQSKSKPWMTR
jgi:hypothetical protein